MPALRKLLLLVFVVAACGTPVAAAEKGGPPPAVEVAVLTVAPTAVTLTRELPGRISAVRVAEVRARVSGIVEQRLFEEGSDVKEGQTLYRIESAPYEASLAAARATLARSEANLVSVRQTAERNEALIESNVVSREALDNSNAALRVAEADAASARASVKSAKITRQYSTVTAPVSGRIGRSVITEGAYVQQTAATLMTTIQQIDSVYVDVTQSSAELLKLRRDLEANKLQAAAGHAKVTLILEDGKPYAETGTLQFADVTVDVGTGSVSLRAVFPNPRRELLPGMFVRARIEEGVDPKAILVPQRAVTRDQKGQAVVMVVNAEKKVERRLLVAERAVGDAWLVTQGLAAGEQVILDGLQKVRPGAVVATVPAELGKGEAGATSGAAAADAAAAAASASGAAPAAASGAGANEAPASTATVPKAAAAAK